LLWRVDGDPPVVASIERASSLTTTAAQMVNRIPDVIVAPAGYLRIEQLPTVAFAGRRAAGSLHGL
jgi:4-hydroxy-tetrahydrodipicolinate reductase